MARKGGSSGDFSGDAGVDGSEDGKMMAAPIEAATLVHQVVCASWSQAAIMEEGCEEPR